MELDQFHDVFFTESHEALDLMESTLLKLAPGTADTEAVNTIFRVAHSIKGGAGMFGFNEVAAFTHTLETLLDELRAGRMAVTTQICEGLLQSVDQIRSMLTAIQKHRPLDLAGSQALQETFGQIIAGAPAAPGASAPVRWRIRFTPAPGLLAQGSDPLRMFDELAAMGSLEVRADASRVPSPELIEPGECHLSWELSLLTASPRSDIEAVFEWAKTHCAIEFEQEVSGQEVSGQAGAGQPPAALSGPREGGEVSADVNSIRVSISKLDELLNTLGEIVITQSMLGQLATRFEGELADRLQTGLAQLESNVRELQDGVMRVRMLPVGSVFSRFPRLVRDLSTRLGKPIRLQISGEQTELDKTVLEKIGDPLVHLIRNSIDHGIETPEERIAAGKAAEGILHLNAFHKGGSINIVVSDDGRGLDRARILEKARSQGLVSPTDVLSDEQVCELLFLPGFSTAARTTDLSGRGVGMDVVRRNINELGGNVELRSDHGKGTVTTITLPLTLAIIDGQSVAVGSETYIVPLLAIVESLQLRPGAASRVHGHGEVFPFRGDYLPVIRLHEIFGVEPRSRELTDGLVMVVEGDGRRAGLFIDDLLGQQQVVIKSLEANYMRIEGVGGATILGEGAVALILDVPGLLRIAQQAPPQRTAG